MHTDVAMYTKKGRQTNLWSYVLFRFFPTHTLTGTHNKRHLSKHIFVSLHSSVEFAAGSDHRVSRWSPVLQFSTENNPHSKCCICTKSHLKTQSRLHQCTKSMHNNALHVVLLVHMLVVILLCRILKASQGWQFSWVFTFLTSSTTDDKMMWIFISSIILKS